MALEVRWAKLALADLDRIDDYYALIDPDVADRIARSAVGAANFLAEWPMAGPEYGAGERRKWSVKNAPYVLIYRPYRTHISVLRLRHMRENRRPS